MMRNDIRIMLLGYLGDTLGIFGGEPWDNSVIVIRTLWDNYGIFMESLWDHRG